MTERYERPAIRDLGSVRALTEQTYNKVGPESDVFTSLTNGIAIGSLTEFP
jgi:hypothetical protein